MPGDRIWIPGDGRAEVQFIGGTYVRADGNTYLDITDLRRGSYEHVIQIAVPEGRTYVNYRDYGGRDSVFQIDTPLTSIRAYQPAKFEVSVYENGYTEVSVLNGVVHVEDRNGSIRVQKGSMLSIGDDRYAELSPLRPRDAWIAWNISRDSRIARGRTSSRYLPASLGLYSYDFDEYGRWEYLSDYGYVWSPRITLTDWAPYRSGRWVWMNGDYVWTSYEPWGWVPYHYGRWAFRIGIGWFWVPPAVNAVFWAPGLVAWISAPTYVSWVPLAPGETYYGYGHYGPHSVNIRNVNVKTINITNVYINSKVQNAVTVVNNDTFVTGKHTKGISAPINPFLSGVKVSAGRPDIKPVRSSAMPLPEKVVHQRVLPQKGLIEKVNTTDIRKRPAAIKEDASVFRAGEPVSQMQVTKVKQPKPVPAVQKPGVSVIPESKQKTVTPPPAATVPKGKDVPQHKEVIRPGVSKGTTGTEPSPSRGGSMKQQPVTVEPKKPQVQPGNTQKTPAVTKGKQSPPVSQGAVHTTPAQKEKAVKAPVAPPERKPNMQGNGVKQQRSISEQQIKPGVNVKNPASGQNQTVPAQQQGRGVGQSSNVKGEQKVTSREQRPEGQGQQPATQPPSTGQGMNNRSGYR
jgi:hypothetical protein